MYQTYELYLRDDLQGQPRFEPLTARSAVQAMQRARDLLETDGGIASVEVRLAGEHLFTLKRERSRPSALATCSPIRNRFGRR